MAGISAVATVLSSPELLDSIFAELPREDAAYSASVCRGWLEVARDAVWRTVLEPHELFSLLAPIETTDSLKVHLVLIVCIKQHADRLFCCPALHYSACNAGLGTIYPFRAAC